MGECSQGRFFHNMGKVVNTLMLAIFIPVLFCVMFIGNKMDYFDDVKADILVPNALLTLIALGVLGLGLWLLSLGRKIQWSRRMNWYLNLGLAVLFTGFFFFCLALSKETVFDMSVDQGTVRRAAIDVAHGIPMGYQFGFSIDYNNLPITHILSLLYRWGEEWPWFHYHPEYLWVIVGCLSVTAAGFCCCEMVKKLTKNPVAVLLAFGLYLLTAGLCPWKYIPYTDSYGIFFPVLCLLLYLYSRDCGNIFGKMILLAASLLSGAVGGYIKPSAYIAILAVLGVEGITFLDALIEWRKGKKKAPGKGGEGIRLRNAGLSLVLGLLLACMLYSGYDVYQEHIIQALGLEYNEELESTLQYYFFSSTNELTTGSFTIEDFGVFGEFQFSKEERNAACMERAWERIRQRGPVGTVYFCLKKLVKSFNDGTFAWTDVRYSEPFPENLTHANRAAEFLRSLFMPGGIRQAWYDTFAEQVWIFLLIGIPGIVLGKRERAPYMVFAVLLIGILVYLMLFESGARYLYIFLPVLIVMSVCGMELGGAAAAGIRTSGRTASGSVESQE